jgi:hypothetical protein
MMRLTIEVGNAAELEKIFLVLKSMDIENVKVVPTEQTKAKKPAMPVITKGDKRIDPKALFGVWKNNPRSLEQIRSTAWDRNWDIKA